MVFGYNAIRKTTFRSWSQGYRRLLLLRQARLEQHLQHHHRRRVQAQPLFQHQMNVRVQTRKNGDTHLPTQPKSQNETKIRTTTRNGETRIFPNCPNGCKNLKKILWMKESQAQRLSREFFFSWALFRAAETSGTRQSLFLHTLPERPKLRDLPEDWNCKGSMQKAYWWSRTSCRKFWWLDNTGSRNS